MKINIYDLSVDNITPEIIGDLIDIINEGVEQLRFDTALYDLDDEYRSEFTAQTVHLLGPIQFHELTKFHNRVLTKLHDMEFITYEENAHLRL